jgi:hypothetical protein
MAINRPMRRPAKPAYQLGSGRGHEFQEDKAHDVPLSALSQTQRDIFAKSIRKYGDTGGSTPLSSIQRKANFVQMSAAFTTVAQLILPAADRTYFLIQNLDAASNLFVGFGFRPDGTLGVGLKIVPGGFYEPFQVPQNDIFISGSGTGNAVLLFAIG